MSLAIGPPTSADDVTPSRIIDAAARSFSFLEKAPADKVFAVGVVYDDVSAGQAAASEATARLNRAAGPGKSTIQARSYNLATLRTTQDRIDALLLLPGGASASPDAAAFVRDRKVPSISSDAACFAARSCVLMIDAGRNITIILDTQLADQIGARFSTVFSMMVTRK